MQGATVGHVVALIIWSGRMMNLCDKVSQEERNKAVDSYTDRLIRSGYSISQVRDIIVSGLTGYERKKLKAAKEKAPLHQPAATT